MIFFSFFQSSLFRSSKLYMSRNLSIYSRFSNLLVYNCLIQSFRILCIYRKCLFISFSFLILVNEVSLSLFLSLLINLATVLSTVLVSEELHLVLLIFSVVPVFTWYLSLHQSFLFPLFCQLSINSSSFSYFLRCIVVNDL